LAEEPDLPRPLLADGAGEIGRAPAGVERADTRSGLSEPGIVRGDRDVADDVEHVTAADGVAIDGADDGLRNIADRHVKIIDLPQSVLAGAVGALLLHFPLVAANAERP